MSFHIVNIKLIDGQLIGLPVGAFMHYFSRFLEKKKSPMLTKAAFI